MKLKHILPFLGLLAAAVTVHAAGDGWLKDFDKAMAQAKEENKVVLVEFHGSDWCPPCIKLNNEVLSTDAFKELAGSSLVLVNADFPRKSQLPAEQMAHNDALAKRFGVQYFPTVLLIDSEGEVLDKMVGFPKGGLDGFLSFIKAKTE
jgi:thiol-disulfide isomerase/thioredoxin